MHYPFGSLLPGRSGSSVAYRYGFNGKEKDNELKGEGNSYDFGARMFDPRIGRWFKMDAEFSKLPNLSPYGYVNNNPLLFIDPDGNFLIDVHKRITSTAFAHSKLIQTTKNYQVVEKYRRAIVGYGLFDGSAAAPDKRSLPWPIGGGQESVHKEHFDSMNYTQIMANFKRINENIDDVMGIYSKKLIDAESLGNSIGEDFHAVQDFFSYSSIKFECE